MKPKTVLPKFGTLLRSKRLAWNASSFQREVYEILKEKGVKMSQPTLAKYETGQILDPDRNILKALCELYGASYENLIVELVKEKYNIDVKLSKHP